MKASSQNRGTNYFARSWGRMHSVQWNQNGEIRKVCYTAYFPKLMFIMMRLGCSKSSFISKLPFWNKTTTLTLRRRKDVKTKGRWQHHPKVSAPVCRDVMNFDSAYLSPDDCFSVKEDYIVYIVRKEKSQSRKFRGIFSPKMQKYYFKIHAVTLMYWHWSSDPKFKKGKFGLNFLQ